MSDPAVTTMQSAFAAALNITADEVNARVILDHFEGTGLFE